ncbi:hypothetical protein K470DRAFT_170285 [Piedraia hortae CBS 480.64]|uniref:Uncharacterized protein n=1 Tax=Piedraia hortae CBS 480.64 TaxID=1314780 RepID=A0A6A7BS74_9PEZI|nr:hypothetical protein K470DRAFT_170285 [Piedraia hortae CBS 480.64]
MHLDEQFPTNLVEQFFPPNCPTFSPNNCPQHPISTNSTQRCPNDIEERAGRACEARRATGIKCGSGGQEGEESSRQGGKQARARAGGDGSPCRLQEGQCQQGLSAGDTPFDHPSRTDAATVRGCGQR